MQRSARVTGYWELKGFPPPRARVRAAEEGPKGLLRSRSVATNGTGGTARNDSDSWA